jgi:integrase
MNAARRRTIPDGLPNRVYERSGSWYWYPKGGTWIKLCRVDAGEPKMLERLAAEKRKREADPLATGDMPALVDEYVREKRGEHRERSWPTYGNHVKVEFADVNVRQVDTGHIADFLKDNWGGKLPMQRTMRAFLKGFFQWCREKRYYTKENPCNGIKIKTPKARDVYISHEHFGMIREQLSTHPMLVCMIDLCYLTAQRSTEIRALLWRPDSDKSNWVDRDKSVIHFVPTKTSESSGAAVDWPITPEIEEVLERARATGKVKSNLVIHSRTGKAMTPKAALWHWDRACVRAELTAYGYTIKDIRAKALTDAQRAGYDIKSIMEAAAHTKQSTTEIYFKQKAVPVSEIRLQLPKSA